LAKVAQALNALGPRFGLAQGWQKHCRQDSDDGDNDEQFEERESDRA
jgi:hypothetical protein